MKSRMIGGRMRRARQRGAAGLVMAGAVALMALGAGTVAVMRQSRLATQAALDSGVQLRLARDQVYAFAARQGRFPCPASSPGGPEDCAARDKGKGYLPVQTLWGSSASTVGEAFSLARYGAYRGSSGNVYDPDLTGPGSYYTPNGGLVKLPSTYDTEPGDPANSGPIINSWDLCHALGRMARSESDNDGEVVPNWSARWGRDRLTDSSVDGRTGFEAADKRFARVRNVAFAIALPDPSDAGEGRSGRNGDLNTALFEDPDRPHDINYRDQVIVASIEEAYRHAQCGVGMMALDHLEQVRVRAEVASHHTTNYQSDAEMRRMLNDVDVGVAAVDDLYALTEGLIDAQNVIQAMAVAQVNPLAPAQAPLIGPLVVLAGLTAAAETVEIVRYREQVNKVLANTSSFTPWDSTDAQSGAGTALNRWLRTVDRAGATAAGLPPASAGTY